ncbi:hypothetical protein [Pantanalinema sp. GBBB05]|uniref:hypothetical protein n=1 Tax=Pantanalinema sp. GBBB05 TaxID=2604139 RepID=UPI001DB557AB|nr:hypothetical protein [Pantanalinema sp. GBBB05]
MLKTLIPLSLIISAIACNHLLAQDSSVPLASKPTMSATTQLSIQQVTLSAREELRRPLGQPDAPNRPIGFADVVLTLTNPEQRDMTIVIRRIEIRDVKTEAIYLTTSLPTLIRLHPLENSVNDVHLLNKTGFPGHDAVKAVVYYEIEQRLGIIESQPVAVTRS